MNLVTLQFKTTTNFEENLLKLVSLIKNTPDDSFILAPELCLNGYSYDNLYEAVNISTKAIKILKEISINKTISLTLTTSKDDKFFNTLFIFSKGNIIHTQSKVKLFPLGDEDKYFEAGNIENMKIIDINGIKVASLICFELRFIELWQRIRGADIILIPAMWGKLRKENFETLTKAIAVTNQCFVLASDSSNDNMASSSAIITPFGKVNLDDSKEMITQPFDKKEIKKMRTYLNIGLKG
ncbi:MAG TPA: carbon-nitrogen hydrolase family protein [Arcobacter sp.]|nr:carbon-nitrogen hydrolase family protein [Arcobacter sp.]